MDDRVTEIGRDRVITVGVADFSDLAINRIKSFVPADLLPFLTDAPHTGYLRRLSSNWIEASAGAFGHILPLLNGSLGSGRIAKLCSPSLDGS